MIFFALAFWLISQKGDVGVDRNLIEMEDRCFSGTITACVKVAEYYEKNRNYEKAIEFLDAACIGGDASSCIKLYVVYAKGRWGKKRDFNTAMGYSTRAGELLGKNGAETFYKQSCDFGDSWGCYHLSTIFSERYNNQQEAQKFLNKAIKLAESGCKDKEQDPIDCFLLGVLYENGRGVAKDEKKALSLYEKACNAGNGGACLNLAYIHQQKGNMEKFKEFRIKSCKGSRGDVCYEIWQETKNKEYLEMACRFGVKKACDEIFNQQNK